MIKPNFFVIGAPKCGTTSLAHWLAGHPQVFMSPVKEPHFFNTDYQRYLNSLEGYERLFADVDRHHLAVGEASVWYLSSSEAVKNILEYNSGARFIVMLRNPIEMAPSLHEELVFTGREDVKDFPAAWVLQERRAKGQNLPRLVEDAKYVQYGAQCSLGAHMTRLYKSVPRDRVKVILLEDIASDARAVYRSVLDFLGVPDDGRATFEVVNQAKTRRWPALNVVAWAAVRLKRALGIEKGFGLWRHIDAANRIERPRGVIDPAMKARLREYFADDVAVLQNLIGRNLKHWLR